MKLYIKSTYGDLITVMLVDKKRDKLSSTVFLGRILNANFASTFVETRLTSEITLAPTVCSVVRTPC